MIKLKQKNNGLYTLKNLELKHLQVIATLVNNTRLGSGFYEVAAFDIANMVENEYLNIGLNSRDCDIAFAMEDKSGCIEYVDNVTIELNHVTD